MQSSNNKFLKKICDIFDLSNEDLLTILKDKGLIVSKSLVNDWFKNPESDKFRPINDDYLLAILQYLFNHKYRTGQQFQGTKPPSKKKDAP